MENISVEQIMLVHAKVQQLQDALRRCEDTVRQRDQRIEFLSWKLRGAEELNLVLRYSEAVNKTFIETTQTVYSARVALGNRYLREQHEILIGCVDELRGEVSEHKQRLSRTGAQCDEWKRKAMTSDATAKKLSEELTECRDRLARLEEEGVTAGLGNHFRDEIRLRDDIIASLRDHNSHLVAMLKRRDGPNAASLSEHCSSPSSPSSYSLVVGLAGDEIAPARAADAVRPVTTGSGHRHDDSNNIDRRTSVAPVATYLAVRSPTLKRGSWSKR